MLAAKDGAGGQARVLKNHDYEKRMRDVKWGPSQKRRNGVEVNGYFFVGFGLAPAVYIRWAPLSAVGHHDRPPPAPLDGTPAPEGGRAEAPPAVRATGKASRHAVLTESSADVSAPHLYGGIQAYRAARRIECSSAKTKSHGKRSGANDGLQIWRGQKKTYLGGGALPTIPLRTPLGGPSL
ncbi:hypothetical protein CAUPRSCDRAFT_11460 [Caulochytrium protostelioides]|uniref:Uncharacterized protein n=1 Tax=Caulochytrium protostelioides TaxID=1555241 RepID=A0A4P9WZ61_9FUNG|nr:hypothetical protein CAUPRSCDRAFT_11460 [Caulochytrium protostelioides]